MDVSWASADRVDRAANAFSVESLELAERRIADPDRLTLTRFGPVVAATATSTPDLDFVNRVHGLGPEHLAWVPAIVEHYRARGLRPWFELAPGPDFGSVAAALDAHGCAQVGVYAGLVGRPSDTAHGAPDIDITPVSSEEVDAFADLRVAGYEIPTEARDVSIGWPSMRDATTYIARIDGRPVGTAVLQVTDAVGYLADASTVPTARGRGVQAALVARRVADAAHAGCDLVGSIAALHSGSHRNLERGGLRLSYQLSVWRLRP